VAWSIRHEGASVFFGPFVCFDRDGPANTLGLMLALLNVPQGYKATVLRPPITLPFWDHVLWWLGLGSGIPSLPVPSDATISEQGVKRWPPVVALLTRRLIEDTRHAARHTAGHP
jgi:hypothetical protein